MSSPRRGAAVLLSLLLLLLAGGVTSASAVMAQPVGQGDVFTLTGSGGWPAYYDRFRFSPPQMSVSVGPFHDFPFPEEVVISGGPQAHDEVTRLRVMAPRGADLKFVPGTYPVGEYSTDQRAGLWINRGLAECLRESGGTLDVREVTRDTSGTITGIALDYFVICAGQSPLSGAVRWNSDVPYQHTSTDFPTGLAAPPGVPVVATALLTNDGTLPISYGATTFLGTSGHGSADPVVEQDGCEGVTLSPGQSCSLTVSYTSPDRDEGAFGQLVTEEGSALGAAYTSVRVDPAASTGQGTFIPVDPVRVLDTRSGLGGRNGKLGPQRSMGFDPTLGDAVPADGVSAVLLNVTGTEPTEATHVRVWPAGTPLPTTSSLNLSSGQDRANQVVVPVGDDGRIALYNNTGSTHLVVDVQGFYATADGAAGGGFHTVEPERVLDTRATASPMQPGGEYLVPVSAPGVDWSMVTAVDVNLTVTEPTTAGHVTTWPGDLDPPTVSNVNFARGQTVANHAVVPVVLDDATGEPHIAVRNSQGTTHLVIDVQGWYDDDPDREGLRFSPSVTTRVADSRLSSSRVAAGGTLVVPAATLPQEAVAHVVNVTATASTGPGHLTAWSGDHARPSTSTVNYATAEDSPNLATVHAGSDGRIAVTANSSAAHVVVDHLGYFW